MSLAAPALAAAPPASRTCPSHKPSRASSRPWRRVWHAAYVPHAGPTPRVYASKWRVSAHSASSTSTNPGTLSIIDSTDDVFTEFCDAQVELVARALGRGSRCMLYLRASGADGTNLQLTEVASYPQRASRWNGNGSSSSSSTPGVNSFEMARDGAAKHEPVEDAFGVAASSFADSLGGGGDCGNDGRPQIKDPDVGFAAQTKNTSITLRGGGSVDEHDGGGGGRWLGGKGNNITNAEALLVKQRVFALPSTNALVRNFPNHHADASVVPLTRDDALVGLLVGEMPDSGGWKGNSARTKKERERKRSVLEKNSDKLGNSDGSPGKGNTDASPFVDMIPEVEVLGASEASASASDEEKTKEAQDTAEKFGDRRRAALAAAARSVVAAWAMHRRADFATAAAMRSDERVSGFTQAAREPLTVLRTLGGMLTKHLKRDTPSKDMAEAIVAQGDVLAQLSSELESALYPKHIVEELTASAGQSEGGKHNALSSGTLPALPAPVGSPGGLQKKKSQTSTATSFALASGGSPVCDVMPVVAGLLASAEVIAKPSGVTMTATFPPPRGDLGETRVSANVKADARDVRETLALVIDAALLAAPQNGNVDVVVRANGGVKGGVVIAVGVSLGAGSADSAFDDARRKEQLLPAGALASAATRIGNATGSDSDYFPATGSSETAAAAACVAKSRTKRGPFSNEQDSFTERTTLREETYPSLQIARSLVESAGGVFHVLPSSPPAIGRVEMWLPAADDLSDLSADLVDFSFGNDHDRDDELTQTRLGESKNVYSSVDA